MQISAQQAATLSQPQLQSFETRAQAFLKQRFPEIARRDDPGPLARFVAHGHPRAVLHGFTGEREIVDYLVVMMQLGPFFDVDPVREPVLRLFLDPASSMKPAMRMRALLAAGRAATGREPRAIDDDNGRAAGGFSDAPPGAPVQAGGGAGFDPSYTVDTTPKDLVEDERGVHGFLPTPGTELANDATWPDWTNAEAVAQANVARVEYHQGLADEADWVARQRAAGAGEDDIARRLVALRNAARLATCSPEELPELQARHLRDYGDADGPGYETALRKAGGDPTKLIASALRSDPAVDVLCGLCKVKEPGT